MITREYIEKLPKDPVYAVEVVCSDFFALSRQMQGESAGKTLEFVKSLLSNESIELVPLRDLGDSALIRTTEAIKKEILSAQMFAMSRIAQRPLQPEQDSFEAGSASSIMIEFSADDKKRISVLIEEIRDIIRTSRLIPEKHKARLFKHCNLLQTELDKVMSNYEVFLDTMVETSEALGEVGENIKPLFDRVMEAFQIAERTRKSPQLLGSSSEKPAQLPSPEDFEE